MERRRGHGVIIVLGGNPSAFNQPLPLGPVQREYVPTFTKITKLFVAYWGPNHRTPEAQMGLRIAEFFIPDNGYTEEQVKAAQEAEIDSIVILSEDPVHKIWRVK